VKKKRQTTKLTKKKADDKANESRSAADKDNEARYAWCEDHGKRRKKEFIYQKTSVNNKLIWKCDITDDASSCLKIHHPPKAQSSGRQPPTSERPKTPKKAPARTPPKAALAKANQIDPKVESPDSAEEVVARATPVLSSARHVTCFTTVPRALACHSEPTTAALATTAARPTTVHGRQSLSPVAHATPAAAAARRRLGTVPRQRAAAATTAESKPRRRRQPQQNTSSDYEDEESSEEESRPREPEKSQPKATGVRTTPKSAPMCRLQKKLGIHFQASTPTCTLQHAMHYTRVLRLEQFVQPTCNDCLCPIISNDLCSVCLRCEPLHLLCSKCFVKTVEPVQIN
jgi:hypothetical protein